MSFPFQHTAVSFFVLLLLLGILTGCAGKNTGEQVSGELSSVQVHAGERVYLIVEGGEAAIREDFRSLLLAYLQSERQLSSASSLSSSDLVVRVAMREPSIASTQYRLAEPREAFALGAMGTTLGIAVGGIAGGRTGALWGAGTGALLGVGVAASDSGGSTCSWTLKARVGIARGKIPPDAGLEEIAAVSGAVTRREEALPALKDLLARHIVAACQAS